MSPTSLVSYRWPTALRPSSAQEMPGWSNTRSLFQETQPFPGALCLLHGRSVVLGRLRFLTKVADVPDNPLLSLIKSYPWKILARLTKSYRSSCWHTHLASKPQAKKATLIDRLARLASPPVPPSVPLSLSLGLALAQALHFLQGDR